MLDNDNRNCNCGNNNGFMNYDCNYTPQGINAGFGYNTALANEENMDCSCANNMEECCEDRNALRREIIEQIKCLNFAIIELALYLDTHEDDQKALCLHREYTKKLKDLKDKYQKIYGPLSIYFPCNKWRWLEEPWPWERSDF